MDIIKYDLKNTLNRLNSIFELMTRGEPMDEALSQWRPAADIREEPGRFVIEADLPGVDAKDIEINLSGNVLTLQGKRQHEHKETHGSYSRIERMQGQFCRQFTFPGSIDSEHIAAHSENGLLEIVVPKKEAAKSQKIKVATSQGKA